MIGMRREYELRGENILYFNVEDMMEIGEERIVFGERK